MISLYINVWNNYLYTFVLLLLIFVPITAKDKLDASENFAKLPFCNENIEESLNNKRFLYAATLDGKLSALDISKAGTLEWSMSTDPGPLLSSSIHKLELTTNGKWVRLIPSLNGGLYKFDGETISAIPISVDHLLSSSFKFSDDLVISGGKETRTYGVLLNTGEVLYECSINGCTNYTQSASKRTILNSSLPLNEKNTTNDARLLGNILIVRRKTQTVRAIEPQSGTERWNFSVAQQEVEFLKRINCHKRELTNLDIYLLNIEIKVNVPDGIIYAYNKKSPNIILWKYSFNEPIASVWRINADDEIQTYDLFKSSQWLWDDMSTTFVQPSIYLGMYQKQLYIQESVIFHHQIEHKTNAIAEYFLNEEVHSLRIPWKPISATKSFPLISDSLNEKSSDVTAKEESYSETALSVLHASNYINGNGFYLFTESDLNKTHNIICDSNNNTTISETNITFAFELSEDDTPVKIIIVSLWFWWKEIIVISLTTSFIINLLLSPKFRERKQVVVIERHIPVPTGVEAIEESFLQVRDSPRSLSESCSTNSDSFTSRFITDFDLVQCLGKGGFGLVFEAKNKIDDCHYAIKRIILPSKKESRDRVMREVKTLANCEHQNIVRYFQAWIEAPPSGWQESADKEMIENCMLSTSIEIETPNGTTIPSFYSEQNSNGDIKQQPKKQDITNICKSKNTNSYISTLREIELEMFDHNKKEIDYSDSFEIEFKNSDKDSSSEESNNNSLPCDSIIKRKRHKRPFSLDLSSTGNVIAPKMIKNELKIYLYIQMQLCKKQSLREWLRDLNLEKRRPYIKNTFEQIIDGVEYVHSKGLIHRDLKPSNIFFALDGKIKIGDFGLVTDVSEMPSSTNLFDNNLDVSFVKHTRQVGTHLYMSPEQLECQPYDFKVDIYSLGLILFEMLVYFNTEMERVDTLNKLRNGKVSKQFKTDFPKALVLLTKMLSINPNERPATLQIKEKIKYMNSWLIYKPILEDNKSWFIPSFLAEKCS